jgi:hypothetical protein
MDREEKNLQERIAGLNDQSHQKSQQLDEQAIKLGRAHRDQDDLKHENFKYDEEIRAVDKENQFLVEDQKEFLRKNDAERRSNDELAYSISQSRKKAADSSDNSGHLAKDLEGVRYSNDALMDRNHELKQELEALSSHADLLSG